MGRLVYSPAAGQCECGFSAPEQGQVRMPVSELNAVGALVNTGIELPDNEYIDIALHLGGGSSENLFAQVVSSGEDGLTLRWLHFDPGEEERLDGIISAFAQGLGLDGADKEIGSNRKSSTRRVVRPKSSQRTPAQERGEDDGDGGKRRSSVVMPFAESTKRETRRIVKPRSTTPPSGTAQLADAGAKEGTRRVVRPRQSQRLEARSEASPTDGKKTHAAVKGDGEESGVRLVIEPTARFTKLRPQDVTPPSGSQQIVSKDGKIDVGATLKSRSRTVRASELAARHDKVRVLNMSTIKELIQAAVQEAIEVLGGNISEDQKQQLLQQAEEGFKLQMEAFKAEKAGLQAQTKNLQDQLKRAQDLLDQERDRIVSADQFTVSAAGMEDLEKRFDRLVNRAIKVNGVNDALADELRNMVTGILDLERERIAEVAREAQSAAIALLEKKVSRLASSLEESERDRDLHRKRAAFLEASGGGIGNIMEAGLGAEDPDRAKKLELLKTIRDENRQMREALKKAGITVEGRRPAKPAAAAEDGKAPGRKGKGRKDRKDRKATEDQGTAATQDPAPPGTEQPVAAEATPAAAEAVVAEDAYADAGDPDDEIWEPGMSFTTDVIGDDEDDADGAVKKLTDFKDFAPPPLERQAAPDADGEEDGDEAYADMGNPDDEIWEPDMSDATDATDVTGDDEDDTVKKLTDYKTFEPPPLESHS